MFALALSGAAAAATTGKKGLNGGGVGRRFSFLPYGSSAPDDDGRPSLSCDGKVPGTTLDLTHWTNNTTPDALYADTSTEIALNFARARLDDGEYREFDDALVVNNHYDTDGVLSVFACLDPETALRHESLLIRGAESGDFGEWSSDEGVKLDLAVSAMLFAEDDDDSNGDEVEEEEEEEAAAYERALRTLPALLEDLEKTGGSRHEHLWRDGFEAAQAAWKGIAHAGIIPGTSLFLVETAPGMDRIPAYAVHRALRRAEADGLSHAPANRILHAVPSITAGVGGQQKLRYRYVYEKPGHGWVKRLRDRSAVPDADGEALAAAMSVGEWVGGGDGGLVAICQSTGYVSGGGGGAESSASRSSHANVVDAILDVDKGAAAIT